MAKIDRNALEVGQKIAWLNHGWVEGVIAEVVKGAAKMMYLAKPGYGLTEFGGASYTTGWKHSIIGADCIVSLGVGESLNALTPPNLEFAYSDAKEYFAGELKLPEVVPQDRNMYREWKEQKRADKVCVETPDEKDERIAREARASRAPVGRTRTRVIPSEEAAPLNEKGKAADVGIGAGHFPAGMQHGYAVETPAAATRTRQRARTSVPVPETPQAAPTPPATRQRVRTR